jgi:hypothetical protein
LARRGKLGVQCQDSTFEVTPKDPGRRPRVACALGILLLACRFNLSLFH